MNVDTHAIRLAAERAQSPQRAGEPEPRGALVAATPPDVVLALLDRIATLEAERDVQAQFLSVLTEDHNADQQRIATLEAERDAAVAAQGALVLQFAEWVRASRDASFAAWVTVGGAQVAMQEAQRVRDAAQARSATLEAALCQAVEDVEFLEPEDKARAIYEALRLVLEPQRAALAQPVGGGS